MSLELCNLALAETYNFNFFLLFLLWLWFWLWFVFLKVIGKLNRCKFFLFVFRQVRH